MVSGLFLLTLFSIAPSYMDDIYFTPPLAERLPLKLFVEDDSTTVASLVVSPWVDEALCVRFPE